MTGRDPAWLADICVFLCYLIPLKLFYNITSKINSSENFYFPKNNIIEFDSIVIMTKFYPWIIKYAQKKGLDPDKPRYLTKVTETF